MLDDISKFKKTLSKGFDFHELLKDYYCSKGIVLRP